MACVDLDFWSRSCLDCWWVRRLSKLPGGVFGTLSLFGVRSRNDRLIGGLDAGTVVSRSSSFSVRGRSESSIAFGDVVCLRIHWKSLLHLVELSVGSLNNVFWLGNWLLCFNLWGLSVVPTTWWICLRWSHCSRSATNRSDPLASSLPRGSTHSLPVLLELPTHVIFDFSLPINYCTKGKIDRRRLSIVIYVTGTNSFRVLLAQRRN